MNKLFIIIGALAAIGVGVLAKPSRSPEAIPEKVQSDRETDPEAIVQRLLDWGSYWMPIAQKAGDLSDTNAEQGNPKQAFIYVTLASTISDLITEIKLLVVAERLATLATDDSEKQKAAIIVNRQYESLNTLVIPADRTLLQGCVVNFKRIGLPEDAAFVESDCLKALERFEKEFMIPRATHWSAKVRDSNRE